MTDVRFERREYGERGRDEVRRGGSDRARGEGRRSRGGRFERSGDVEEEDGGGQTLRRRGGGQGQRGRQGRQDKQDRQERRGRRTRMPLEEPPERARLRGRGHEPEQSFKCGHCKRFIGALPSGGHHRNHCPLCLYSRHVDDRRSGDRLSRCGALMEPIGAFQRPNGEHVLVHRCLGCGFERFNRIAADDDFEQVLSLPVVPPRSARPGEMA